MGTVIRKLTQIKELIEEIGFNISYPFDDLLFVESNAFLIQFDDSKVNSFFIYFNEDLDSLAAKELGNKITSLAHTKKVQIKLEGKFQLTQKKGSDEELELRFIS